MKNKKLSNKQQELVTKNYGLIGEFCRINHINMEDYSDVLSIALCESALSYDETRGGIKFSTYAFAQMKRKYIDVIRNENCLKHIPKDKMVSGDALKNSEEEDMGTLFDSINAIDNVEDIVICRDMVAQIRKSNKVLTERQKQLLDYMLIGLDNKQAQIIMQVSLRRVEMIKSDIRNRIGKFLEL